jgi:DNA-3-methyladenine glycosylase
LSPRSRGRGTHIAPRFAFPAPAERARLLAGLSQPPPAAARFLLGQLLVRRVGRRTLAARIVETEAYLGEGDPAAHSFRGRTARTEPLWGRPGTIYVYFIYGMHHCLNLAVEAADAPGCVLIRAAEPVLGLVDGSGRGPGRLARALDLDTTDSGLHVFDRGSRLYLREGTPAARIGVTARIGIRAAADRRLRFFDRESVDVSGPRALRR